MLAIYSRFRGNRVRIMLCINRKAVISKAYIVWYYRSYFLLFELYIIILGGGSYGREGSYLE